MLQGDGNPPRRVMSLFTRANYKFSTHEPGRSSTFYFSDLTGNRGRFRRQHSRGPELVFQGRCKRIFVNPDLETRITHLSEVVAAAQAIKEKVKVTDPAFNLLHAEKRYD